MYKAIVLIALLLLILPAYADTAASESTIVHNPRLENPDPGAWKNSPMEEIIADFQESDGIFSSFICDELVKRLATDTSNSLKSLNSIDKNARTYAFRNCFSPELDGSSEILSAVAPFSEKWPELVEEIIDSAKE